MPNTDLWSIVYVSSAVRPFTEDELESILLDARVFNLRHRVTGVLLYCDGNLMQCIEGPKDSLDLVYSRIRASRRHRDIIELLNRPIRERSFSSWEMGMMQTSHSDLVELSTARWEQMYRESADDTATASWGLRHLRGFWERARR